MADLSPFPSGFLGVELFYNGTWNDITDDVDQDGVSVTHGIPGEGSSSEPSSLTFTVQNPTGKYSPRNPKSPLYGLIGRNTPCRAFVQLGAPRIYLDATNARVTAPDSAPVSITGDLDIRWEGLTDDWDAFRDLMSKYATGGQASWLFRVSQNGFLVLFWSEDGTNLKSYTSTVAMPSWAGHIALRAVIDVNDGAGGHRVRFYYGTTLDSNDWQQLGDEGVGVGVTSIFDSTSVVTIGKNPDSSATSPAQRIYGWEIRNGIGGSIVSSVRTANLTVAASTFSDGSRTWTLQTGASITQRHYLFTGEVSEWPMTWGRKGGPSVLTEIRASGSTRRLGQGAAPIRSSLYRGISKTGPNLVAYWPMEDGSDATSFAEASGASPITWIGTPFSLAGYEAFRGSMPIPMIGTATMTAKVPKYVGTGFAQVRWFTAIPLSTIDNASLLRIYTSGTLAYVDVRYYATGDGLVIEGISSDNTSLGSTNAGFGLDGTKECRLSVELTQSGANINWAIAVFVRGNSGGTFFSGTWTGATIGAVTKVVINSTGVDLAGMPIGHLTVEKAITSLFDVSSSIMDGYIGEQADSRIRRIATEEGVAVALRDGLATSPSMGPQATATALDLFRDAEAVDGGILHDDRDNLGLRFRTLRSMYSQPGVVIDYTDNLVVPFEPLDDDAMTRNRVTVARSGGSSFTVEDSTSAMSTQPVPDGVGIYDESLTLNLANDDQCEQAAGWRVHIGTWDEGRYPRLGVDLAHPAFLADPELTRDILAMFVGDRLLVTNPPDWLPPMPVDVIVQGIAIEVTPLHVRILWSCVPGRPYRGARYSEGDRYSGEGTVTAEALDTTETGIDITNPSPRVQWTHDDGDYDIVIGGERMTVTAVTGSGTAQTLTVTRSVNGVVKAHSTGAAVRLYDPVFYGL